MAPNVRLTLCAVALGVALMGGCGGQPEQGPATQDGGDNSSISVRSVLPRLVAERPVIDISGSPADERQTLAATDEDDPFRLCGTTPDIWLLDEWTNSDPYRLSELRGRVVVVRFFDIKSEGCERSMRAMQQLHEEFAGRPVMFLGVQRTTESEPSVEWSVVKDRFERWGVTFPVARDKHGITLHRWWLRYFHHVPHTPAFVIGPDGRIVHVQPGPEFHPSDDVMFALCNRDYLAVHDAIQSALPRDVVRSTYATDAVADVP